MDSRMVQLHDGMNIHYLSAGDVTSAPVVMLHGYPANSYLWRHSIPELARQFYIIAPDLPGHGKSDKPLDVNYDLDYYVSFLLAFYSALGIQQADLIAHDLGGMIALGFVSRYPDMTGRFIIMDTAPYVKWPPFLQVLMKSLRNPFLARLSLFRSQFKSSLKRVAVYRKHAVTDEMVDLYLTPWVKNRNSRKAYRKVIMAPPEKMTEPIESLRKIQQPTLIIWADKDRVFPIQIARDLNTDLPNSKLAIVSECGHFLPEEQPEVVTRHLVEFLNC